MATKKLSAITPSPPTAVTDQVVGVIGGTTDALMSLIQLHDLVNATGDLNFYVATTGSDSNPGTSVAPFLTIQYALNVAAAYNYLGMYYPTINVADGTYVVPTTIALPTLTGGTIATPSGTSGVIACNPANPGNVVIDVSAAGPGIVLFIAVGGENSWQVDGFQGNATGAVLAPTGGSHITSGNDIICYDPTNGGLLYLANLQNSGRYSAGDMTVTFLSTTIAGIVQAQNYSFPFLYRDTINFQTSTNVFNGLYYITSYSELVVVTMTYAGTAGMVSAGSFGSQFSNIVSSNAAATDFPDGIGIDGSSLFGSPGVRFFQQVYTQVAEPTPADLPVDFSWGVFYDATDLAVWIAANIGGGVVVEMRIGGLGTNTLPYVVTTAKLTPTGTQGSMTFIGGVLIAATQAT